MDEEHANNIVSAADETFGLAILRRCVGAREKKYDTMVREEVVERSGEEFASVVTLQTFNGHMILSLHKFKEMLNGSTSIRFIA
jgi:hypothetical protein